MRGGREIGEDTCDSGNIRVLGRLVSGQEERSSEPFCQGINQRRGVGARACTAKGETNISTS